MEFESFLIFSLRLIVLGENLEPISDERAHRVLHRVNLINTIRNKVCFIFFCNARVYFSLFTPGHYISEAFTSKVSVRLQRDTNFLGEESLWMF